MKQSPFLYVIGIVLLGSLMASSAAIWIRFLPGVSPIAISFIRVAGASMIFLPWFWHEWKRKSIKLREFRYSALAGIALALHFATWISSLKYTTVANSVLFVATHPVFVIAISLTILRLRVAKNQIIGSLVALVGVVFIQWRELSFDSSAGLLSGESLGNILALLGGFFAAVYLLLSWEARKSLSTMLHVEVTYATAAIVLLVVLILVRNPLTPLPNGSILFLGLLILLPTVGGHTIFNWGVHHIGAPRVSLFGLMEPIESALLAFIILGEQVSLTTILGGCIIISGLLLAVWQRRVPADR
ncbi:DMT family transporter [Candidatus Neomarinimicrobiota bacterium]